MGRDSVGPSVVETFTLSRSKGAQMPLPFSLPVPRCPSSAAPGKVTRALFLPSNDSQSCWEEGSVGKARALYSNTTELEMIWLLKATCRVTRPVSWAESKRRRGQGEGWGRAPFNLTLERPLPAPLHGVNRSLCLLIPRGLDVVLLLEPSLDPRLSQEPHDRCCTQDRNCLFALLKAGEGRCQALSADLPSE